MMLLNVWNLAGPFMCVAAIGAVTAVTVPETGFADAAPKPKSIRMTCGKCPDGYATTGLTQSPEICKDDDPTLVECVPLGANMLAVCGACPEGYAEIGSSSLPARCGDSDGGRLSQCQLRHMQTNLPDPNQGFMTCPPDCGSTARPGQGALSPPPKYPQFQESKE
jgi:hypothetical protein